MLNQQIPMKKMPDADPTTLWVHSIFPTIQGEGIFAGVPAVFLRLGGCNLQCPFCDTDYTEGSEWMQGDQIVYLVRFFMPRKANLVVITGGEPMRQKLGPLIKTLNDIGYIVQIETNGTLFDDTIEFDKEKVFVMCSPKTGAVNKLLQPHITAYKYVGGANEKDIPAGTFDEDILPSVLEDHGLMADGLPKQALGHTAKPHLARPHKGFEGRVYLQPIDTHNPALNAYHTRAVVESCLDNGYTLCLQLHKFVGVD
jgi:organic radical activating enzyme